MKHYFVDNPLGDCARAYRVCYPSPFNRQPVDGGYIDPCVVCRDCTEADAAFIARCYNERAKEDAE